MSETVQAPPPQRRASLGTSEGEDIFGTFDINVAKRFLEILKPHRRSFIIAVVAVLLGAVFIMLIRKVK